MIDRRSLLVASGTLPISLIAAKRENSALTPELVAARELISAFFLASNAANWQFVNESLADFCHGESNHSHWAYWAKIFSKDDDKVQALVQKSPKGYLPDRKNVFDFFRSRQYQKGWEWLLPNGKDSIWSPATDVYCSYSKWKRTDGGSYWAGAIDHSPTFFHLFGLKTVKEFETKISSKIDWVQEIDVRNVVYG